jgi:hypothetical protein
MDQSAECAILDGSDTGGVNMAKQQTASLRGGKSKTPDEDRGKYNKDIDDSVSLLATRKDDIIKRLEAGEGFDIVTMDLTNSLLQAVVGILPSVEKQAKTSSRGVYPLVNLTNIVRELGHDLRSMQDRNTMREKVMSEILDPKLLLFARSQITALNQLARKVRDPAQQEFIESMRAAVAKTVNEMRIETANALDAYFGGDGKAQGIVKEEEVLEERDDVFARDDEDEVPALPAPKRPVKKKGYRYARR